MLPIIFSSRGPGTTAALPAGRTGPGKPNLWDAAVDTHSEWAAKGHLEMGGQV